MDIVAFAGGKLSELTGQYEMGCVALIKLSAQDAGKDPAKLSYQDMRQIVQVQLLKRLERINAKEPAQVTAKMLKILDEGQSLFTMAAH
jgi:hypothetical protein